MSEKEDVLNRLRRVEGQVRGLARMIEEGEPCQDILTQVLAVGSALDQVALRVIARYMEHCLPDHATPEQLQEARQNLRRTFKLLMRF